MLKIIEDNTVVTYLDDSNNNEMPKFSKQLSQIHIDYKCGCKITQDKRGNWLFPCQGHKQYFEKIRNGIILK